MVHFPVMLGEALEWLDVKASGTYVDCTLGAGGYAEAIAGKLTSGQLIALDRDPKAIETTRARLGEFSGRIRYVQSPFGDLGQVLQDVLKSDLQDALVDGIVADLGLSRDQLGDAQRGFSFMGDGPLDMRFSPDQAVTAADIVNYYGEKPLADLLYRYGEERRSRRISRAIVRARPLQDTRHLAEVIERAAPRTEKIHPATRSFQALRIAVNDELGQLEQLMESAPLRLKPGGRLVVITFHSLEDRAVKVAIRRWSTQNVLKILTKHVVRPGDDEIRTNPPSRSAKLRAAERRKD